MNKRTTPQRVVERANIVLCSAEGRSGSAICRERFFSELTTRQLKRLAVTSVDQLIEAINHYIDRRNDNPTPFVWTASAQSIIAKVSKAKETLATQH